MHTFKRRHILKITRQVSYIKRFTRTYKPSEEVLPLKKRKKKEEKENYYLPRRGIAFRSPA